MNKISTTRAVRLAACSFLLYLLVGCNKQNERQELVQTAPLATIAATDDHAITQTAMVLNIRNQADGSIEVVHSESARIFTTADPQMITTLRKALKKNLPVQMCFDPWHSTLTGVTLLKPDAYRINPSLLIHDRGLTMNVNLATVDSETLNSPAHLKTLESNSTLTNVIPDIATAQLIFNYLVQQCCVMPAPYQIDYCIPFQYALDGCHARAHKMCYVINTKFNYDTHKIFSIANDYAGDWLCVQAQKWGGCCIKWWYHVAPLVNVQTPGGVKAFVIDPSMFDQPVLLTTWLHAQENPVCSSGSNPNVTKISVQPTASYKPNDWYNQTYMLDPYYSYTNNTLSNYHNLTTCH